MKALATVLVAGAMGGCFSEQSFPMKPEQLARMPVVKEGEGLSTREWTERANALAAPLLPRSSQATLTGDQFSRVTSGGNNEDVYQHFDIHLSHIDDLWWNISGLEQTAQVSSPPWLIGANGHIQRAAWAGFKDVYIQVDKNVFLYGRLGEPDKKSCAAEIPGSYIVVTHGLFGSIDGLDMANEVEALRRAGHHVLAVEMRGHGETYIEHPEYTVSFGITESSDLLTVDQWLRSTQGAKRVGLLGFSLTGFEALMTAWLDGKHPVTEFDAVPLLRNLPKPVGPPAFNGGMFIVSPPVDMKTIADAFEERYSIFDGPCKARFQSHVAERMAKVQEKPSYSLWDWADSEFRRAGWDKTYANPGELRSDLVKFLDLRGGAETGATWEEGVRRMDNIRIPVLMLASANDPLATAQGVVELFSRVKNPNIGVVMLGEGGHMGFPAVSADYYYSMMLNFFDPKTGPAIQN